MKSSHPKTSLKFHRHANDWAVLVRIKLAQTSFQINQIFFQKVATKFKINHLMGFSSD